MQSDHESNVMEIIKKSSVFLDSTKSYKYDKSDNLGPMEKLNVNRMNKDVLNTLNNNKNKNELLKKIFIKYSYNNSISKNQF